ncbi:MAG TPA: hypothetical protein VGQ04_20850 [Chitinophagaceae bacterium]|jgi:hypothetical protein|nr:hypothetical protein [Chitinophagaceae bacterium]
MRKVILQLVKATFPILAGFSTLISSAYGQQNIIAGKDDTHPEIAAQQYSSAKIYKLSAIQMHGYNEIQWSAVTEEDTRRFIVEYSSDGINYQSAGELTPLKGDYSLKHYTLDTRTFLYRIRMEKKDGRFFNSISFLLDGVDIAPVKIYPTIVEGYTLNLRMAFPVHRMSIISPDGKQVMAKDLGGIVGTTQVAIPVLSRGQYLVTFYGNGWQSTEKFMVGG